MAEQEILDTEIDPLDYFNNLKNSKHELTDEFLKNLYTNTEVLLKKSHALGQHKVCRKLLYSLEVLDKEKILYDSGFQTFVYRDDIEYYMDKVRDKAVKIITLQDYPREIPDAVASRLIFLKEKGIFDEYYVVFTDYTGNTEREVQTERRRKDPIVFGAFAKRDPQNRVLHDRFYYIADWEDEYCDLTLSKMVSEMSVAGRSIAKPVFIPDSSVDSIRDYMNSLEEENNSFRLGSKKKKSFFDKIKLWSKS